MAEKDKEPLLGYTGAFRRPNYKFYREEWVRWLRYDYRTTLAPDRLDEFWFRDENGAPRDEGKGSWLADLSALPNWGLLSSYFNVGVALMLGATPISYYLVEKLDASAAVVNTYGALTYLPWSLKFFYGTQSDLVPFLGMHRRSYYVLGWAVYAIDAARVQRRRLRRLRRAADEHDEQGAQRHARGAACGCLMRSQEGCSDLCSASS